MFIYTLDIDSSPKFNDLNYLNKVIFMCFSWNVIVIKGTQSRFWSNSTNEQMKFENRS